MNWRYDGEETVDLEGREARVHVIELEGRRDQVRLLLDADHLLIGVLPLGESNVRFRISTPTDER